MKISEVQIVPIKPANGLVGFASCVFDDCLYLGSIGIVTRPNGGYRLVYPTKKVAESQIDIFHPLNHKTSSCIEDIIIKKFNEVVNGTTSKR